MHAISFSFSDLLLFWENLETNKIYRVQLFLFVFFGYTASAHGRKCLIRNVCQREMSSKWLKTGKRESACHHSCTNDYFRRSHIGLSEEYCSGWCQIVDNGSWRATKRQITVLAQILPLMSDDEKRWVFHCLLAFCATKVKGLVLDRLHHEVAPRVISNEDPVEEQNGAYQTKLAMMEHLRWTATVPAAYMICFGFTIPCIQNETKPVQERRIRNECTLLSC